LNAARSSSGWTARSAWTQNRVKIPAPNADAQEGRATNQSICRAAIASGYYIRLKAREPGQGKSAPVKTFPLPSPREFGMRIRASPIRPLERDIEQEDPNATSCKW